MHKILLIIQREYLSRVRKRSFIIATLLAPVGFLLLIVAAVAIGSSQSDLSLAIVDESGLFKNAVIADGKAVHFHFVNESFDALSAKLESDKDETFDAVMQIPASFNLEKPSYAGIQVFSAKKIGLTSREFIKDKVNELIKEQRLAKNNISAEMREQLNEQASFEFDVIGADKEAKGKAEAAAALGYLMALAIYITLLVYGTMIMKGVQEEKNNRIVEVLTSSVKPFQLMLGKIVGVGAVGLTQFILWAVMIFLINLFVVPMLGLAVDPHQMQSMSNMHGAQQVDEDEIQTIVKNLYALPWMQIVPLFLFYFLGGFLLYGALFAAVGAASGEEGDNQSLVFPITVPIIIAIMIAMSVLNNPESQLSWWGSLVPFTSPVVMPAMLAFGVPWWQTLLSMLLLIAGFIFTTWMASRIYRTGILMYGKKVTAKEMMKWVFAKA